MKNSAEQPVTSDAYHEQLAALSAAFDDAYNDLLRQTRATPEHNGRPLLIILGDEAMFLHEGRMETAVFTSPLYQRLTTVNYIGPGLILTLAANSPGPLLPPTRAHLERQLEHLNRALDALDEQHPPTQHHKHQQQTLEQAQTLINVTLISGLVEEGRLHAYEAASAALQQENAALSAAVLLDTLHAITNRWRKQLDLAAWGQLRVIIAAIPSARHFDAACVYFQHLLQQSPGDPTAPETQLIYAANIATVDQALDLLAQPLIAQRAGGISERGLQTQRSQLTTAAQATIMNYFLP